MEEIEDVAIPADFSVRDIETAIPLTALDRCDRCGAAAKVRVVQRQGFVITRELMFCGHHTNKYAEALTEQGFTVVQGVPW